LPAGLLLFGKDGRVDALIRIALVAFGGALGSLARWGVSLLIDRWLTNWPRVVFPWATFVINITGCFFLGWFITVLNERLSAGGGNWIRPDSLRLMIAVGFTGAYTTFSTFEFEANRTISDGEGIVGVTYIAASVILGLLAVRLGVMLARWM
jgi:CrcB protein